MPEFLQLPPVAQGIAAISAVAFAVVRLLTASKPFWAWERVPVWVQKLLPALLMAVAAVPLAIEHARSWFDVVVALVVSGGTWYMASRGDKRPPAPPADPKPVAAKPSQPHVFLQNDDGSPIEMRAWPVPRLGVLALLCCLVPNCASLAAAKPPCNDANMRAIDAAYIAEVGSTCLPKYKSAAECPAYARIRAKHRAALRNECPR